MSGSASAQWGRGRDNDRDLRNLRESAAALRENSREFARRLDRELDRSRYDGTRAEDRLNSMARELAQAAGELQGSLFFTNSDRVDRNMRRVFATAKDLENALARARVHRGISGDWMRIRRDLNALDRSYTAYLRDRDRNGRRDVRNVGWGRNY